MPLVVHLRPYDDASGAQEPATRLALTSVVLTGEIPPPSRGPTKRLRDVFGPSDADVGDYQDATARLVPVAIVVTNAGSTRAERVRVEIVVPRAAGLDVRDEDAMPIRPRSSVGGASLAGVVPKDLLVKVADDDRGWVARTRVAALEPGAEHVVVQPFYVGSSTPCTVTATARAWTEARPEAATETPVEIVVACEPRARPPFSAD